MSGDEVFLLCKKYLSGFKYIMPGKMLSSKNSNIKSGLKNQPTPTLDKEPYLYLTLIMSFLIIIAIKIYRF